ncbi:MAG: nucleotidyl transferase AbiEii/AbiGii toxin family protein [Candidatus Marinimicrobia bacterium]|nr:nucleotidyl transferase AbiEii/AbiGii toxin family protein [Candidatus Neomarinimicrobiota bacterium]
MNRFIQLPGKERGLYFVQTAERMRISPQIVEKDFWVCWILSELFALPDIGNTLIFKGGTSLSKAYRLIKRFSEDVDMSINRTSLGFDEFDLRKSVSNTERKRRVERLMESCRRKITEELRPAMIQVIESRFKGMRDWSLEIDADDADRQTLLYKYPSSLATIHTYIRPVVKIEFGARSDHWPSCQAQIMSYVAQQGSLRITPFPSRIRMIEEDYNHMQEMFFSDRPEFIEVLKILDEWEHRFNQR